MVGIGGKHRPKSHTHTRAGPTRGRRRHQALCLTNWKSVQLKQTSLWARRPLTLPCKDKGASKGGLRASLCSFSCMFWSSQSSNQKARGPNEAQEKGRVWLCHRTPGTDCRNLPLPFPNLVKEQGPLSELGPFVPVLREETTSRGVERGGEDGRFAPFSQSIQGSDAVPSPRRSTPS